MTRADIEEQIRLVNYRRQVRKLSYYDVLQVLSEALRNGIGYRRAGSVANAYSFKATSAAAAAVKSNDKVYLKFGSCDAHRTASQTTWFGPQNFKNQLLRFVETFTSDSTWIELSKRNAQRLIRGNSKELEDAYKKRINNLPDVVITFDASITAGNCRFETERVAKAFNYIPQKAKTIAQKFPSLIYYIEKTANSINNQ